MESPQQANSEVSEYKPGSVCADNGDIVPPPPCPEEAEQAFSHYERNSHGGSRTRDAVLWYLSGESFRDSANLVGLRSNAGISFYGNPAFIPDGTSDDLLHLLDLGEVTLPHDSKDRVDKNAGDIYLAVQHKKALASSQAHFMYGFVLWPIDESSFETILDIEALAQSFVQVTSVAPAHAQYSAKILHKTSRKITKGGSVHSTERLTVKPRTDQRLYCMTYNNTTNQSGHSIVFRVRVGVNRRFRFLRRS